MAEKNKKFSRVKKEKPEFDQQIVDIARVTRVMAGGKRMRFRACVVIGNKKGKGGIGLAKAKDVPQAVQKAGKKAERDAIIVNLYKGTIPHEVSVKLGSAKLLLKPAPEGTGIISGGAARIVLELSGVRNVVSKILGTNNKVNNVKATIKALSMLKSRPEGKESKKESAEKKASEEKKPKKKAESKEK